MNRTAASLWLAFGACLVALAAWLTLSEPCPAPSPWKPPTQGIEPVGPGAGFLRGAHWFGAEWAVNHWNTHLLARAADDFAALREDGFNTVVLVVPWAGFMAEPTARTPDPERMRRLAALLETARDAELNVVLRLGYAWDAAVPRSGGWNVRLWQDEAVREGWLAYLGALGELVADQDHVRFGFISWEDLWAIIGAGSQPEPRRRAVAGRIGFRDWLRERYSLVSLGERYATDFTDWNQVPVPRREEPAFALFLEFMDHAWIERFFRPARAVFPRLSMEIRVDADAVYSAPGEVAYYHQHHAAWDLPGADWTTIYWSPSMNGLNQGETLSPRTAARRLETLLREIRSRTGDRPIFIGQFLVEDFTPGYENNGRLAPDTVGDFLARAAKVLRSQAHGYALWAWRDYRHNAVPSPDFSLVEGNWQGQGEAVGPGAPYRLAPGETLARGFAAYEFHVAGGATAAELCLRAVADGDSSPDLRVRVEPGEQVVELDVSGNGLACTEIRPGPRETELTLEALAPLDLRYVHLSGFTQPIGIRDLEGEPKPVIGAWRALNTALVSARPACLSPP